MIFPLLIDPLYQFYEIELFSFWIHFEAFRQQYSNNQHRKLPISKKEFISSEYRFSFQIDRYIFLTSTPCNKRCRPICQPIPPVPPTTTATLPEKLILNNYQNNRYQILGSKLTKRQFRTDRMVRVIIGKGLPKYILLIL